MTTAVPASPEEIAAWTDFDGAPQAVFSIGGPEEAPDVRACPALVSDGPDGVRVHVAHQLDEIEVAQLATGGKLWLTTWGGLPIHSLVVVGGRVPGEAS